MLQRELRVEVMYVEMVCGPPGSGKTTYVEGKRQYTDSRRGIDDRIIVTVNLDPANDGVFPYPCDIDIGSLIEHRKVMEDENLGPNGGYLFCIDFIAAHTDWLCEAMEQMARTKQTDAAQSQTDRSVWFIVDCPGQVEFYIHSDGLAKIVKAFQKTLRANVVMTHLCDGMIATRDVTSYVSTCLLSLTCMIDLELPHVNVLTKWDLVLRDGDEEDALAFLESGVFLDEHFNRMWRRDEERRASAVHGGRASSVPPSSDRGTKMRGLCRAVLDVVDGFGLVGFEALDVQNEPLMRRVCDRIDMAAGLVR